MISAAFPRCPDAGSPPLQLRLLPPSEAQLELLEEVRQWLEGHPPSTAAAAGSVVVLAAGSRPLCSGELQSIQELLSGQGLALLWVETSRPETRVVASALGLEAPLRGGAGTPAPGPAQAASAGTTRTRQAAMPAGQPAPQTLQISSGPIRAGEHLQVDGSVLVLGDVNPGGKVSAGGHVLVWGKLRGVAHAGSRGDRQARITALHLRPLQLRIADVVARGPQDVPPAGLAEEARLDGGAIVIDPAPGSWPLARIPTVGLNLA